MKPLLTVKDVAKRTALAERTVRQKADLGEIPAYKLGKVWRFKEEDIDDYIRMGKN